MIRRPPEGVIMAERDEAGAFFLNSPSRRRRLKDSQVLCINDENIFEFDIFLDIRRVLLDENRPGDNNGFGFGLDGFPRVNPFIGYERILDEVIASSLGLLENEGVFARRARLRDFIEEKQAYLATFCAQVQLENGDTYLWLNTGACNNYFSDRDSNIYERFSQFNGDDILNAGTPYGTDKLYPFGRICYTVTLHPEDPHSPPRIIFTNPILHPNIFLDGSVDPMVYRYADNWRSGGSIKNMFNSILRFLRVPDDEYIANVDAATKWRNRTH